MAITINTKARGQRKPYEVYPVALGQTVSGTVSWNKEIPVQAGYLWTKIRMILHLAVTIGSGDYGYELGGYYFANMIDLMCDGRQVVHAPGAAFYWLNGLANRSVPYHLGINKGTGTYDVIIDIPFKYPAIFNRAEDFLLDDRSYSNVILQAQFGTIADLMNTVTGASVVATADVLIERAPLADFPAGKPTLEPMIRAYPQLSTSAGNYWDLESNKNLQMTGFFILSGGSNAAAFKQQGGANGAWGGSDAWDKVILDDSVKNYVLNTVPVSFFQEERNLYIPYQNLFGSAGLTDIQSPSLVGFQPYIFPRDGSVFSTYPTAGPDGNKARLRLSSGNITASKYSDLLVFGGRKIAYDGNGKRVYY